MDGITPNGRWTHYTLKVRYVSTCANVCYKSKLIEACMFLLGAQSLPCIEKVYISQPFVPGYIPKTWKWI